MNPVELIDHPPADAEPPPNAVLTAQVMEQVRHAARQPAPTSAPWPWYLAALVAFGLACLPLDWELDADLGLDPLLLIEMAATGLIAVVVLAWKRSHA